MGAENKRGIALIPARAGSLRVKDKNIRPLSGHPLIAYTIEAAKRSNVFAKVLVTTDSDLIQDVARHYGAESPFLRPKELASSTAVDIGWIKHAFDQLEGEHYDFFSILRPTSPFRTVEMIRRAHAQFIEREDVDSIRAVNLVHEHPGKMWVVDDEKSLMTPFLDQSHLEVPWHARQYQDCPRVYVQNSSLEMAWTRVVADTNSREGRVVAPFLTSETEGFSIDYEIDWALGAALMESGQAKLLPVARPAYPKMNLI